MIVYNIRFKKNNKKYSYRTTKKRKWMKYRKKLKDYIYLIGFYDTENL